MEETLFREDSFNFDSWKGRVNRGYYIFLLNPAILQDACQFITRMLDCDEMDDDTYYSIFFFLCENRQYELIKAFFDHPSSKGRIDDHFIRRRACFNVIEGGDFRPRLRTDNQDYIGCLSLLLHSNDPKDHDMTDWIVNYRRDTHSPIDYMGENGMLITAVIACQHVGVCSFLIDKGVDPYKEYTTAFVHENELHRKPINALMAAELLGSPEVRLFFKNHPNRNADLFSVLYNSCDINTFSLDDPVTAPADNEGGNYQVKRSRNN